MIILSDCVGCGILFYLDLGFLAHTPHPFLVAAAAGLGKCWSEERGWNSGTGHRALLGASLKLCVSLFVVVLLLFCCCRFVVVFWTGHRALLGASLKLNYLPPSSSYSGTLLCFMIQGETNVAKIRIPIIHFFDGLGDWWGWVEWEKRFKSCSLSCKTFCQLQV